MTVERITAEFLGRAGLAGPIAAARAAPFLRDACAGWGIDTPRRVAGFLSQCAVESCGFTRTSERLGYSAERLRAVFPGIIKDDVTAARYAKLGARAIANRVYANRLGNGDETSGDGYRFRGRAYIQITGRTLYTAFDAVVEADILGKPDLLCEPEFAAEASAWYWSTRPLNEAADAGDVKRMTRLVNGPALLGLEERGAHFERALRALEVTP